MLYLLRILQSKLIKYYVRHEIYILGYLYSCTWREIYTIGNHRPAANTRPPNPPEGFYILRLHEIFILISLNIAATTN